MSILCVLAWLPVIMGVTYLIRESELTESWRSWIERPVARFVSDCEFDRDPRPIPFAIRVRMFVLAMLSCAPCTSAWVSLVVSNVLWIMSLEPYGWQAAFFCNAVGPLASCGALWMVTILSPLEAFAFIGMRKRNAKKVQDTDASATKP